MLHLNITKIYKTTLSKKKFDLFPTIDYQLFYTNNTYKHIPYLLVFYLKSKVRTIF